MAKYDHQRSVEQLLRRMGAVRGQILRFVRELDEIGVVPGFLPEGAVQALAETDAALSDSQERLISEDVPASEVEEAEAQLEAVEAHVRDLEQALWAAAVKQRPGDR